VKFCTLDVHFISIVVSRLATQAAHVKLLSP
jgi:hypothetical protein